MNISKLAGFVCGIGVVVLLMWALRRRLFTDGSSRTEYDERQKAARGIGYKYGYYTLLTYLIVLMGIDCMDVALPVSNTVLGFTGLAVSGLVLAWYCIMHDAYWGMNNNIGVYTRFFIVIGAINLIFGILEMAKGRMIVDGVLQNSFVNFEAGLLIAGIGIMLLIKRQRDSREESGI